MMGYDWIRRGTMAAGALTFLAFAASPARPDKQTAAPTKVATVEGITEYRLDNGTRILLFPDSSTSKLTVNATVFVGSRHEGYGETGMAHLLEHMLFKGTPTHRDIPKALRDRGAEFNGTTWLDRTNYYETLQATDDNLEFAIRLEADRLVNSFIKREDLASEMTVVRNEFEAGENSPVSILFQRMTATAYEWHNYGKSTIGNRSDIERVPVDRLKVFYKKYYQPDNVMLIIAGNFKPEKALALVVKYFGSLLRPTRQLEETYTEEPPQDGERLVILRRSGSVAATGAVYHIPAAAHEDFAAIDVLATALDMEPSGPLYKALVQSKKATRVTTLAAGNHDPGLLEIIAQVEKENSPEDTQAALIGTMEKIAREGLDASEIERAKLILRKNWNLQMTSSNSIGVILSDWAGKADWRLFFLHRDRVASVSTADVKRVAARYLLASNRTTGLFLPTKDPQRAQIPAIRNIPEILKDYQGGKAIAQGETFVPTVDNIESRVERKTLSGGLKAAFLPHKTRAQAVTALLTLRYGNPDSLKGHTSATQFLAPLMACGTKKHSRQELADELNKLQARVTPGGLLGELDFHIECKREHLPAVLMLVREILREPTFPKEEFEILRRQFRNQLEAGRTEPTALAFRAFQRHLAPYAPDDIRYAPSIDESLQRLAAVSVDEVKALYEGQLGGQNGEFVVVGDFEPFVVLKQMDEALAGWKAPTAYCRIERPAPQVKSGRLTIDTPDKANAVYVAGLVRAMKDTDPQNAALEVANFLLGGGSLSSRLGNRVRQKEGLSYGVGSQFGASAQDPSARFLIFAICNPKNIDKVDAVIAEEVEKMRKEGMSLAELEEGKKAFLERLKQERSTDAQLAEILREGLEVGRTCAYYADLEKKVASLSPQEVTEAFRTTLNPADLFIIHAGDFKKKAIPQK
jgi:zinc protease